MELLDKLTILADAAKYDAACTSSGLDRAARPGGLGSTLAAGCCHTFSADGRCVTLLKVLMTNRCMYDCAYCVNRRSNDLPRATFTPRELAELTIAFYRRNYIEGLFLSSAVWGGPDRTTEGMIEALRLLREEYGFWGYIHAKAIPGADPLLTRRLGLLADRLSVNIELPSEESLNRLCPDKEKRAILAPMAQIRDGIRESRGELAKYRRAPRFAPAGQSTQMIIGATPESDRHILTLTQALYDKYKLKRVFYSAYMPVSDSALLPARGEFQPPLLREHRLYQADWLLRFYHFRAEELLDDSAPNFDPRVDPKCSWALRHLDFFPVEVNRADYEALLRVPGIGVTSARRILTARRVGPLTFSGLKTLGVVLKRAQYFLTCVFDSYAHREEPMGFSAPGDGRLTLWPERRVETDQARARRVYRSLDQKLGAEGKRLVVQGFLTCLPERELHLWRFLRLGYEKGPGFTRDLAEPRVAAVWKAVRHLTGEAHLLKGFTRFSEIDGVLVGEIAPKNRVLPLLRPHFCARYPGENFALHDRTHREVLLHRPGKWAIVPAEDFSPGEPGEAELQYRRLWRRFYDAIAIEGRYNPRCRMTQMPKRYWGTMTEFQTEKAERKELGP